MGSRTYDKEFKLNAILLCKNGKGAAEVCRDLGIPDSTFSGWIKKYNENGEEGFPGSGNVEVSKEALYQLQKRFDDVKMERDILKKALAIFSKQK